MVVRLTEAKEDCLFGWLVGFNWGRGQVVPRHTKRKDDLRRNTNKTGPLEWI